MTGRLRVLVAPDKFKGTLSALEAAEAIAAGVRQRLPDARIVLLPVADGGEGTVDAVVSAGGDRRRVRVRGPMNEPVDAEWVMLDHVAVIEMAQASGLHLVQPSPATALGSHTVGTGELIVAALDAGARRIVIGVGGSATTDGGTGALRALGVLFTDESGAEVPLGGRGLGSIARCDLSNLDPRVAQAEIVICSDVSNPMSGPDGAAHVFAAQKGADAAAIRILDDGLRQLVRVFRADLGVDLHEEGWGGAGGGIAGGLRATTGASAAVGIDVVGELIGLESHLHDADVVIVGEGSMDRQSLLGKAPVGVAERAAAHSIPAFAVVGVTDLDPVEARAHGILGIAAAATAAGSPRAAIRDPGRWVTAAATVVAEKIAYLRKGTP